MTDSVYTGEDFAEKVKTQVEFYFSDLNLQTDKFLWRIYEANDGWVELKTILTFGRMRQYRPEEKVIAALKTSDKLLLSPNEDMVRRKDPLKDFSEIKNTRKRNSVHVEGFPTTLSQDDVEDWFNKKIVPQLPGTKAVNSVRRARTRANKEFLGVVDVEFQTLEDAEFFLKAPTSYEDGLDAAADSPALLKKMSLLTFRQMKELGKRFGVNEVTKRRNLFKENGRKRRREEKEEKKEEKEEKKEEKEEKEEKKEEKKEVAEETKTAEE